MTEVKSLTVRVGEDAQRKIFTGRAAWALNHLIKAGQDGCTPIDHPGPRWSHYCWLLRGAGLNVETITESHGGTYGGHHARYVLRSLVEILEIQEAGALT